MGSILDHFRCGLRYGYYFGELTGWAEVDFWSFLLRIDPSPQNEFGPFFTLGPTFSSHSMTLGPTIFSHFTTQGPTIFSHSLTLEPTILSHSMTLGPTIFSHSMTQ